jgi:hypothetical protein
MSKRLARTIRGWCRDSLFCRVAGFVVLAGALTDAGAARGWTGSWNTPTPSGRIDLYFLLPMAITFGLVCGVFLVKHSPRSFLREEELSDDPQRPRHTTAGWWISLVGALSWSVVIWLPITGAALGLKALGV